jgi:YEATS domain-containing protein 4
VKEEGQGEDVKMEGKVEDSTNTSTPAPAPVDPATSNTPDPNSAAPADSGTPASPLEASVIVAQPQPISIAQKYPVHSWQYDELVFTDPTTTFLELMNAHPPTALPPKNRRARDQREGHDSREGGKKGKKARQSAGPGSAIKGLMSGNMASGEKEKGLAAIPPVGIPGEPGSADVPLEFSQEMEKGEWNRLNEARVRIVEEMDSWRERLIAQEKELARLKEEMKV